MVEQSDRAPLLDWEDVPSVEQTPALVSPETDSVSSPTTRLSLGNIAPGTEWSSSPRDRSGATAGVSGVPGSIRVGVGWDPLNPTTGERVVAENRQAGWEKDQIVAVFVVTFDTRSGNLVEWCLPQDVDLEGVEFKSMASGSHRITSDFIYFRKGSCFGLACFANMPVESELERGARMKSVGVLCPSYTLLYRHMNFLENQVRLQLQCPGQYSALEAFYEDKKALLPPLENGLIITSPSRSRGASQSRCMHPEMKISHPAGCMSQFIRFLGEQIMLLWKFSLLRKRILIFSPPPIGVVCYRVYCCCCLANVSLPGVGVAVPEFRPFFYISVADITTLETEVSYVACTTEKIFEEKQDLYDVYVDNQNVRTHRQSLQPLLHLNSADRQKYRKLSEQRQTLLYSQDVDGDCTSNEEELFVLFFMELNDRIFQTLYEVAGSLDQTLTEDHVRSMGLDPQGDHGFLVDLLELYGIDVTLDIDNPCCS
ncbi:DENN domain-containing protein 11-like [Megalops cyprinoides]|uniref:DENN domain-containing protein 11-like n=1 Tax=Megalops cyprinoides TaxID=118141 RepID=UPI0018649551|nr:DENN domain-containing protein 11-like [Megalops cyprinoides]